MYIDLGVGNPKPATSDPRDQTPVPSEFRPPVKMEIPGSGAQIQVPGAQHEAYVGEVEKSKKPENFREPKKCPPGTRESGFRAIFLSGADFFEK